ncbi:hypothetical protein FRC00_004352 [Tulasnella sp. 408]|nr:hypothetical protein FRC00_004352 [Tulasnella sp. 408]
MLMDMCIVRITLDGVTYQGADPYGPAISSPIRQVSSNSPATPVYGGIKGVAMACGGDAKAASITVPMTAGSEVSIYWGSWPHNVGPIITYLGKCDGPCSTTDPTKISFFKIHQIDFVPGTHTWVQSQTLYKDLPFNFTLPEDLPNGDFIMRHEVIALHNAMKQGGAEIFPQCIQVTINCGSGKIPVATAKFPGAYSATDPGILINVYDDPSNLVYRFPGPVLALEEDPEDDDIDDPPNTLSASSSTSSLVTPAASSTSSSASVTSTDSAASSATTSATSSTASASIDYNLSFDFGFDVYYACHYRFCITSNDFDFRCVDYISGDLHNGQKDQDRATDNHNFAGSKYFFQLYFNRRLDYGAYLFTTKLAASEMHSLSASGERGLQRSA